jgi:hypothetical protein
LAPLLEVIAQLGETIRGYGRAVEAMAAKQ